MSRRIKQARQRNYLLGRRVLALIGPIGVLREVIVTLTWTAAVAMQRPGIVLAALRLEEILHRSDHLLQDPRYLTTIVVVVAVAGVVYPDHSIHQPLPCMARYPRIGLWIPMPMWVAAA